MKILALELSSPQRSVAVVQATGHARSLSVSEVVQTRERGAGALEMIAEALRQARLEREQIERLAIVGEKTWHKWMTGFCKPFTSAEVRYFTHEELDAARAWVNEPAEIWDGSEAGGAKQP